MPEINVTDFQGALSDTLRRYLFTANFISDSELELRREFWRELQEKDVFARAPLVSAVPTYRQAESVGELLGRTAAPHLHQRLGALAAGGFSLDQHLYAHQVGSLRIAQLGRNLVVATGTGSGKTECFLLPVLDDALRHPGPGVRTIIVYPMNALANDQLDRLRELLRGLPEVTFGRYTGDTVETEADLPEEDLRGRMKNQRLTREEIRNDPPHILLTNFAMLEYLLLRPDDNAIFRQQRLRFVVLDEAHSYSGSQGIDVGMLMRRLQETYQACDLQFLLTSATIGGENAVQEVVQFAESLCGKPFNAEDVLRGHVVVPPGGDQTVSLSAYAKAVSDEGALSNWIDALDDVVKVKELASVSGLQIPRRALQELTTAQFLHTWLSHNAEVASIHSTCSKRAVSVSELAEQTFGNCSPDAIRITRWLVLLSACAVERPGVAPLIPARYHFFFRGLGGGSVCLAPNCSRRTEHPETRWSRLVLEDRRTCPDDTCGAFLLPLCTCVHCGMPAVRVYEDTLGHWHAAPLMQPQAVHLLTWFDWDEEEEEDEKSSRIDVPLCLRCGKRLSSMQETCCAQPVHVRLWRLGTADVEGNLKKCPNCGGTAQPYPSVLREMVTYEDAATAVLGEALIRALPLGPARKPADGRRMLVFSDSRQRAAHYAPYLARTCAETQFMKPLLQAVEAVDKANDGHGATIDEIVTRFRRIIEGQSFVTIRSTLEDGENRTVVKPVGALLQQDYLALKKECLVTLLQHCVASPRRRDTLSAFAQAAVLIDLSQNQVAEFRQRLPLVYGAGEDLGDSLVQLLLISFLQRRILDLPGEVILPNLGPGPQMATCHYSQQRSKSGRQVWRWNPYEAERSQALAVRRSRIVALLSRALKVDPERDGLLISGVLRDFWDAIVEMEVLKRLAFPGEFQIPYDRILLTCQRNWYLCSRCGRFTVFPIGTACPTPECGGEVTLCTSEQIEQRFANHHGYHRLRFAPPLPLEVREHTAQLTNSVGREYQHKFRSADVNVLSSSTTFELGVDVGTLKTVFLRNVPPTPANYIQRAGRAGRRLEGTAFAVTYARNLPHDQFHYFEQRHIVSGTVPPPRINISNVRLAQRHINSYLLAGYLRALARFGPAPKTVREFFFLPSIAESPASRFVVWLHESEEQCLAGIRQITPPKCSTPEDSLNSAATQLRDVGESIQARSTAYEQQRADLEQERATATPERLAGVARALASVHRLRQQLLDERLIDFLAGMHWLPAYAFPQDVVRLLVRQSDYSARLRLERDAEFGISEYAPGSEIIADGKLLRSGGIDKQNKELELLDYRACPVCRRVVLGPHHSLPPQCPCGGHGPNSKPRPYVVPLGFTTMVEDAVEEAKLHRLKPPPNSEVFLIDGAPPEAFRAHPEVAGISCGYRPDGRLFRANRGRKNLQFRLCLTCGASVGKDSPHRTPWGTSCSGQPQCVDLACVFDTDTLQIRFDNVLKPPPPIQDNQFWVSLQSAFLSAAADSLTIPARDLDGTYRAQSESSSLGELIIYDRVPGGAGYVQQIIRCLETVLNRMRERTANCPNPACDRSGSCYACLRTYGNQFQWHLLNRGRIADWLLQFSSSPEHGSEILATVSS